MKVNIILFLLVAGSIFVVGTDGAGIRAATGGEFREGFTSFAVIVSIWIRIHAFEPKSNKIAEPYLHAYHQLF